MDTTNVVRSAATPTGFTYVLVDTAAATRTCIHSPQTEELTSHDMNADFHATAAARPATCTAWSTLSAASVVHFDGRHTAAALTAAQALRALAQRPILALDAERDRPPHFDSLLSACDIVFTNAAFPLTYAPLVSVKIPAEAIHHVEDPVILGMHRLLHHVRQANMVITTRGAAGALLLRRVGRPSVVDVFRPSSVPPVGDEYNDEDDEEEEQQQVVLSDSIVALRLVVRDALRGCPIPLQRSTEMTIDGSVVELIQLRTSRASFPRTPPPPYMMPCVL